MTEPKSGLYTAIPNDDYHRGPGVSKTMLDLLHRSPALLEWNQNAPVDEEAETAVDVGNAFEAALLEPDRFEAEYIEAPQVDRRTNSGKAQYQEFLEEAEGKTVLTYEEARKIRLMVESTWAHPMARRVLEAKRIVQGSYYWTDPVTDLLCRCRPDLLCTEIPFVVDIKTTADVGRFSRSIAEYRYHVQDAFYSDGLTRYFEGVQPYFIFLVVSTSRAAGRYPVHAMELHIDDKHQGVNEYRADLEEYAKIVASGDTTHLEEIRLPRWARAEGGF